MKKKTIKVFMLFALGFGWSFNAMAQTAEQKAKITAGYDQEKHNELQQEFEARWQKTFEMAKENNWPLEKVENGKHYVLGGITEDNKPYYKTSSNNNGPTSSTITARVNHIRTGGDMGLNLNGQGMVLGIWEIDGLRTTHEQFGGRVEIKDGTSSIDDHATHVACTMIGSGNGYLGARGLAYQASKLLAYNSINDTNEVNSAAQGGLLVSNHSYGLDESSVPGWWLGAYIQESRDWDNIMYNHEYYQMVLAAGNSRNNEETGELLGNANSKNVFVVAAVEGVNWTLDNPAVTMSSFSTYGPTDDGRIKPDISMKGVNVRSALSNSDSAYGNENGTSMAAPGVAGTLALIQQHYSNLKDGAFMRSATLRGLVIHTATDPSQTDPGPDYRFGWGVIDAQKAVELITKDDTENDAIIQEVVLNQGETDTYTITSNGPVRVTISWTDPAGTAVNQNTTSNKALVNDLDLRVLVPGSVFPFTPWKLQGQNTVQGDNNRDNVEVVDIDNAVGNCTISVTHKGTLQGGSQKYSIIISSVSDMNAGQYDFNKFSIYPNPATDVININYGDAVPAAGKVTLYDLQGRQVKNFDEMITSINVEDLNSGMYILNIEHGGNIESRKVIIK